VLVTGATGRVGRAVVDLLIGAGVPVRALTQLSPAKFRSETEGSWPRPVVDMLLAAWGATIGRPAFITSTVSDILGSAPQSFRQWVAGHATAIVEGPTPSI
jgi:nucleoside-diphosphate-sugar epimerase